MVLKSRRQQITVFDSWTGILGSKTFDYFTYDIDYIYFKDTRVNYYGQSSWYFALWFVEDEESPEQKRIVITLFDILSEIGGIL
jgi:hypothetical protein